jgi:nitronate monooxygenase
MRTLRNTERVLTNTVAKKVLKIESKGNTKIEDIAPYIAGTQGLKMLEEGDTEAAVMSAGQIVGLIQDIPTVRELMDRIIGDAREILRRRFSEILSAES